MAGTVRPMRVKGREVFRELVMGIGQIVLVLSVIESILSEGDQKPLETSKISDFYSKNEFLVETEKYRLLYLSR